MIARHAILAVLLSFNGCVTAPNSNQSITINLLGSLSRSAQSQGGTNTHARVQSDGGGGNGAHASMTP